MDNAAELINTFYGRFDIALTLVESQQQQEDEGALKCHTLQVMWGLSSAKMSSLLNNTHAPVIEWR